MSLVVSAACDSEPAPDSAPAAIVSTADSSNCPLPLETVTQILGKPVHMPRSPVRLMDSCTYRLDRDSTIELELSIKPAETAELFIAGLQERMHARLGPDARADAFTLGDGGWAYESATGSEAAARKGDRLYHAVIASFVGDPSPRHKAEMIRLVEAMVSGKE